MTTFKDVDLQGNKYDFIRLISKLLSVSFCGEKTQVSCKCCKFTRRPTHIEPLDHRSVYEASKTA